ncbi:DUF3376 domain-containing protein [Rhodococcoides trifolii]|uniref:DUF3376 domain-containing protein n=1 Tax=Rhodococcoides trifolii TaxID=908250 RepID=UPI001663620F|nr:DUF3376 domain-containing protein [Rhodococcus trifolii]
MSDLGSTTLRLTLAMRGGVSLAVWIGGAVAEIDNLRRASLTPNPSDPRMRRYRELLAAAGYGKVEVDILAGASAGGFNAVLYGLAQSYGASLEPTRDLWANTGGIWQMLRPVGIGPLVSFLQGDDYFLPTARMSLGRLTSRAGDSVDFAADNVTVELAATRIDDGSASAWGSQAAFSFVRSAGSLESGFSTIPGSGQDPSDPVVARAIDRLALAARATSSFPAAFEPATISSLATADDVGERPNMATVFPYARDAVDPGYFDVIDGGVLDNIPVDRAIRAIGRAAASTITERRLFYLDPEPPRDPLPMSPVKQFVIQGAVTVIRYATALKKRTESVQDELPALRIHNEREQKARARSAALAGLLERGPSEPHRVPALDEYARFRIDVDTERLADLLTDPSRFVSGAPGFARPFGRVSESATLGLRERLQKLYLDDASLVDGDIRAVRDIAALVIAWVRELERLAVTGDDRARDAGRALGRVKALLYRVLTVTFDARRRTVDLVYARGIGPVAAIRDTLPDIESLAVESARAGRCLPALSPELDDALCVDTTVDDGTFYAALANWSSLPEGSDGVVLQRLWDVVSAARGAVYDLSDPVLRVGGAGAAWTRWRGTVFSRLYAPSWRSAPAAHLFTTFAATGDVPGTSSVVQYHEIRGDQFTPLAYSYWLDGDPHPEIDAQIESVIDASMRTWISRWIHDPAAPVTLRTREKALTTDAKLAGNVVARFGGFLHAGWRVNDWKWGRMDAAAGLVDSLGVEPSERGAAIAELQKLILADAADVVEQPETVGDSSLSVGAEGVRDLAPSYLFALVTRLAVLAPRVLWPSEPLTSAKGLLGRVGSLVLRPLLPPLILASDAVRVALAAATLVLLAQLVGMHTATMGPIAARSLLIVTLAAGGVMVWRWRAARTRWSRLVEKVRAADEPEDKTKHLWVDCVDSERAQHVRAIRFAVAAVLLGCVAAVWALISVDGPATLGLEAAAVLVAGVVVAVAISDARTLNVRVTARRMRYRRAAGGFVAAGLVVATVVLAAVDVHVAESSTVHAVLVGLSSAALSGLSLWGWSARTHAASWIGVLGVLGAAGFWVWSPGSAAVLPFAVVWWTAGVSVAYLFVPARETIEGDGL